MSTEEFLIVVVFAAILLGCHLDEKRKKSLRIISHHRKQAEQERNRFLRQIEWRRKWRNKFK